MLYSTTSYLCCQQPFYGLGRVKYGAGRCASSLDGIRMRGPDGRRVRGCDNDSVGGLESDGPWALRPGKSKALGNGFLLVFTGWLMTSIRGQLKGDGGTCDSCACCTGIDDWTGLVYTIEE